MRICKVNGRKAIFHCWEQKSEIVAPTRGGHSGGVIKYSVAIIEYEDGVVNSVPVNDVVFLDTKKVMFDLERKIAKRNALANIDDDIE